MVMVSMQVDSLDGWRPVQIWSGKGECDCLINRFLNYSLNSRIPLLLQVFLAGRLLSMGYIDRSKKPLGQTDYLFMSQLFVFVFSTAAPEAVRTNLNMLGRAAFHFGLGLGAVAEHVEPARSRRRTRRSELLHVCFSS